jgi:nucleoside-diphosphate-sugar epimerase
MEVLITGATGLVGRALARRLLEDGDRVRALVRDVARASDLEAMGARTCAGDVGDPRTVYEAARGCGLAVHAAGISTHRAAPRALAWTNVAGTENVLRAARKAGVRRVVVLSCADVTLCDEDRIGWNEDRTPARYLPDAHAETKRLAEELALASGDATMEVTALRPAPVWGPGDLGALPALCAEALAAGGLPLYGDGSAIYASAYVDNVVDALVAALSAGDVNGRAYYVQDAEFLDAREFFGMLSRACGLPAPRPGPAYPFAYAAAWLREKRRARGAWRTDVVRRGRATQLDVQRALRDLDWRARTTVEDGMRALEAWVRAQGGPDALARRLRPPPDAASVDAQVALAGGDAPTAPR